MSASGGYVAWIYLNPLLAHIHDAFAFLKKSGIYIPDSGITWRGWIPALRCIFAKCVANQKKCVHG